jgi:CheY-like chemotaxis protein
MLKPRVLVVDDYPGARYRRMRILAEDGGFEVMEEFLGRPAVQRAVDEHVDLVLVDLHLPNITGVEVCRAIRENPRTATLPVLLISTVAEQSEAATLAQASGANGFLPDSVEPAELVAAIRKALAG